MQGNELPAFHFTFIISAYHTMN